MAARKPDGLNAKDEALRLVDDGSIRAETMLVCALKSMSDDEAWIMLDDNELSPRFFAPVGLQDTPMLMEAEDEEAESRRRRTNRAAIWIASGEG